MKGGEEMLKVTEAAVCGVILDTERLARKGLHVSRARSAKRQGGVERRRGCVYGYATEYYTAGKRNQGGLKSKTLAFYTV